MKFTSTVLGLTAFALLAGCASNSGPPEYTGVETPPLPYQGDTRVYSNSWGHTGRGGAALRKPTYQHVLGDYNRLDTQTGRLYPTLSNAANGSDSSQGTVFGQRGDVSFSQIGGSLSECAEADSKPEDIHILTSARVDHTDYIRVRNKLCAGVERLTYSEWQILVNGTPKDLPLHMQAKPAPTNPISGKSAE